MDTDRSTSSPVAEEDPEALRRSVMGDLLAFGQACSALGISRYTLSRWISAGRFAVVQIGTRRYVSRAEIAAYVASLRAEADERRAAAANKT